MLESTNDILPTNAGARNERAAVRVMDMSDDLRRHFRNRYPIFLDGALPNAQERGHFLQHARETLTRGGADPSLLPAAILRETLDCITPTANPSRKAGLTAIGPKSVRVWWSERVLDNLGDVLARLDSPRPLLRFYDVTGLDPESGRWNEFFDVDVALNEQGRTQEILGSDRVYVVDLGYAYADGRFLRLARTNTAPVPRDGKGAAEDGRTARSNLRQRQRPSGGPPVVDARAREWAEARKDHEQRDMDAELFVHMVYRMFLEEGPRALRRYGRPYRRDSETLRREYVRRGRIRQRRAKRIKKPASPSVLVIRLDSEAPAPVRDIGYPVAPVKTATVIHVPDGAEEGRFAWFSSLLAAARDGFAPPAARRSLTAPATTAEYEDSPDEEPLVLVEPVDETAAPAPAAMAKPVFEAAESLRESLAGLKSMAAEPVEVSLFKPPAPVPAARKSVEERIFGGAEAKRMARAGVRITRMALTLEGRMRPGARFKVAGKLVHADADGRFRLECVLAGRRASIPMRAGASIGGEVRSMINVDWERRAGRDKKILAVD